MTRSDQKTEDLLKAILTLETVPETRKFFRDLLTEKEIAEFGNRWKAARMLFAKNTYPEIRRETGLSTRTIARISKWLNSGTGGYKLILKKIEKHHPSQPSRPSRRNKS
jgi:TrpR-related protein YerC/YecD